MTTVFVLLSGITSAAAQAYPTDNGPQRRVISRGQVNIRGTVYPIESVLVQPPSLPPQTISDPNLISKSSDFQYGLVMNDASQLYGAQINITYFSGQGNPQGFSVWVGAWDNKGFFYQAGLYYWANLGYSGWYVDNYPNGGNNGLQVYYPPSGYNQFYSSAITSASNWVSVLMWLYQGQWYAMFLKAGSTIATGAFPRGADGGSYIDSNGAYVIVEGGTGSYTSGLAIVTDLMYVWKVQLSGGVLYIYVWFTNSLHFYKTSGSDAPPNTSCFGVMSGSGSHPNSYYLFFIAIPLGNVRYLSFGSSVATRVP